jgi:hypothetical protein
MEEVPIKGKLTTSSNAAMSNSLTDGSTETFWESRDEPRGKPKQITITFDKEREVFGVSVHIDNQKDGGVRNWIKLNTSIVRPCIHERDKATFVSTFSLYCSFCFCVFFQQRVESVTLLVGRDEDSLKEVDQVHKQINK